ncbi:ubiquinone-dependent pyruvate dehydrogenase [Olivibacter sp. SDN3]|uniref:thiamine pyrophosphate-dependent enzyme n=1 Tax=Olivibacter sp. SDN3 TaxID=2764720 RepID=UPI00165132A5|nr:thiamine pyrophosphate-dependent enzyme [Olivibacter sp. SDN3]QNL52117.1 ubiquinone-dependent pyruvate dehydrogenase [Olivibacter sp. SDN3]
MAKKVADQLVETLLEAGIKRVYAVTGDSLNEFNDAVRRNGKLQWIHVRHEEVGAYAAAAEAELNGIACCAGSSGPGHVHLINGLYDANRSGVPVLAIASTMHTDEMGSDYFQETNTIKLFDDCSVYNQIATTAKQFPRMLQAALQHAYSKKGVAVIGMPGDVAMEKAEEIVTETTLIRNRPLLRPKDNEIQALAAVLNEHKRITVFCGIGCKDAHDEVVSLSKRLNAPVGYSFRGKMYVQYDNPNEVGMTGLLGLPAAYHAMHESDLVLLLGTDFPYKDFMPESCGIIQVDERPERLGRRAKLKMGLVGDIKDTLQALLPLIEQNGDTSFLDAQLKIHEKVMQIQRSYANERGRKDNISPEYLADTVDKLAADDAIFTVDTGMSCVWGARFVNATGKRELLGSFNHGSMANAMPQAIGAALARPKQQVVAFCGDGGISMLLGDLATIVQYNLPIKLIVFDNRSLGMVKLEMEVAGLPQWQTDMYNPDFATVAMAMGMKGLCVDDPALVEQSLREVFTYDGPVLVHVKTDPNALAMPPKIEFSQMKGYAITMGKLILSGRMDEVLDTVRSNYKHLKGMV